MNMSNIDIIAAYRKAEDKDQIIQDLADINECNRTMIIEIVKDDMEIQPEEPKGKFSEKEKEDIIKRYRRSENPPTTLKLLMKAYKCSEEDIKKVLREHAKTTWKNPEDKPKEEGEPEPRRPYEVKDARVPGADVIPEPEKKKIGRPKKDETPLIKSSSLEGKPLKTNFKFDKKWYDAQKDLENGEDEEVVAKKYGCSAITLRRMLGRLRSNNEKNKVKEDPNPTITETIREELKIDPKTGPDRLQELVNEGHFNEECENGAYVNRDGSTDIVYESDPEFKEAGVDESQIHPDPQIEIDMRGGLVSTEPNRNCVITPTQIYEDIPDMNYVPSKDPNIFENVSKGLEEKWPENRCKIENNKEPFEESYDDFRKRVNEFSKDYKHYSDNNDYTDPNFSKLASMSIRILEIINVIDITDSDEVKKLICGSAIAVARQTIENIIGIEL